MESQNHAPRNPRPGKQTFLKPDELAAAREYPFGEEVLGYGHVVCLECGRKLKAAGSHVSRTHGMPVEEYKEKWGYAEGQALSAGQVLEHSRNIAIKLDLVRFTKSRFQPGKKANPATVRHRPQSRQRMSRTRKGGPGHKKRPEVTLEAIQEALRELFLGSQVCKRLACSMDLVRARLHDGGTTLDEAVTASFVRLFDEGLSVEEIAAHYECHPTTVRPRLIRAGRVKRQGEAAPGVMGQE